MKKLIFFIPFICLILFGQSPSDGSRTMTMGTFSGGGASEADYRSSVSYKCTDNIGDGSKTSEQVSTSTTYKMWGGFRNVDRDLREPASYVAVPDTISSSAVFYISWAGIDTTFEDGQGWGIWKYDIQWSKSSDPGNWHDWHIGTELTNAWFGPEDPTEVKPDTIYYFRARAYDLATNVEDYPADADDFVVYNPPTIALEADKSGTDTVWVSDTSEVDEWVNSDEADRYIVKNRGSEYVDLGLYSFNTENWKLEDEPGYNQYSLRALFNEAPSPPMESYFTDSCIVRADRENMTYATPTIYGPGGYNLHPVHADSMSSTSNLWLQIRTPTMVSRFGNFDNELILMKVEARTSIY
ncbi:MAG: hypothetical protein ACLFSQ_12050 [Candidatus Zixiibacteriota bacterium]